MEHLNNVTGIKHPEQLNDAEKAVFAESCLIIPRLMYFFAPHISEELWAMSGHDTLVHEAGLIQWNPAFLIKSEITYVIQVMGKVRGKIVVPTSASQDEIKALALANENVQKFIEGKTIQKVIVIPKKLVSIVAK